MQGGQRIHLQLLHGFGHLLVVVLLLHLLIDIGQHLFLLVGRNGPQEVQQHQLDLDLAGQHLLDEHRPLLLHLIRGYLSFVFQQGLIDGRQQVAGENGLVAHERDLFRAVVDLSHEVGRQGHNPFVLAGGNARPAGR